MAQCSKCRGDAGYLLRIPGVGKDVPLCLACKNDLEQKAARAGLAGQFNIRPVAKGQG